jgi:hypothetical protein
MVSSSLFSNQRKGEKMTVSKKWQEGFIKYGLKKGFIKPPLENEEEREERIKKENANIQRIDAQTKSVKKW